jgi:hypothetical protein
VDITIQKTCFDGEPELGAFDAELAELGARWRAARLAACGGGAPDEGDELGAVRRALEVDAAGAIERAFDHSLRLGEGFRRFHKLDLPLDALAAALPRLGAVCLERSFHRAGQAATARGVRGACAFAEAHPRACEFWREATEGLVLGMTSAVRHARHRSAGAGDEACVDLLYVDPRSPERFGPLPLPMEAFGQILGERVQAMDSSARLELLGLSEGVLYYALHRQSDSPGAMALGPMIERSIQRRFPRCSVREVSSRPVLGPEGYTR